jgi:hypothetical protein
MHVHVCLSASQTPSVQFSYTVTGGGAESRGRE